MKSQIDKIILELFKIKNLSTKRFRMILANYPKNKNSFFSKEEILFVLKQKYQKNKYFEKVKNFLQKKPSRTLSGVTPITVLTKPYKCIGKCIFCPNEIGEPKSYLSSEPGAQRAKLLNFDPFNQTLLRIKTLEKLGHDTSKIELIILGGTWSCYDKNYRINFIYNCFLAMNNKKPKQLKNIEDLIFEQRENENSIHRCVGISVETRPDFINEEELIFYRMLGITKVQVGVQSLNDKILLANKRDHLVQDVINATKLLRQAGFKIHYHIMVNLFQSTPAIDFKSFKKQFDDKNFRPDEIKFYPCMLLKNTELYDEFLNGKFQPYKRETLINLIAKCKETVPSYVRISRLFRDIPSFEVVKGVKETNLREVVQKFMAKKGKKCRCIRCREIKNMKFIRKEMKQKILTYKTSIGTEKFISIETPKFILGFLRLTLPNIKNHFLKELKNSAIIRELHIYGTAEKIGSAGGHVQHKGLGKILIKKAAVIAKKAGFEDLAVISAIGTKNYYRKNGFIDGQYYMHLNLRS